MADRYQLKTIFDADNTTIHTHTLPASGAVEGQGAVEVQTKWRRKKEIGTGGYGIVWLEEEVGGRKQLRAIKRLPQAKNIKWSRELDIMHRDLFVEFLGWYEDEEKNFVYFAMEYIEHGDLGQYLGKFGSKAISQAKDIVTQILKGLVILHEERICHRDIKPNNILIASISPIQVKIADFGVSKNQENTSLYSRCGTSGYLAPELQGVIFKSGESKKKGRSSKNHGPSYTNAVDIWSLGILTHKILTLEIPFLATDPESESESESGLGQGQRQGQDQESHGIDMVHFLEYCEGKRTFPIESLRKSKVSSEGIEFVKALLVADPRFRMPTPRALESPWLLNKCLEPYFSNSPSQIPPNDKAEGDVQKGEVYPKTPGPNEILRLTSVKPSSTLRDNHSTPEKESSLEPKREEANNKAVPRSNPIEEERLARIQAEVERRLRLDIETKEQKRTELEKELAEIQRIVEQQEREAEEVRTRARGITILNYKGREARYRGERPKARKTEAEKAHREEIEYIRKKTGLGEVGKGRWRYNALDPRSIGYIPGFAESWSIPNGVSMLFETPLESPPGTPIFPQHFQREGSTPRNTPLVEHGGSQRPPSASGNSSTMVSKVLESGEEKLARNVKELERSS